MQRDDVSQSHKFMSIRHMLPNRRQTALGWTGPVTPMIIKIEMTCPGAQRFRGFLRNSIMNGWSEKNDIVLSQRVRFPGPGKSPLTAKDNPNIVIAEDTIKRPPSGMCSGNAAAPGKHSKRMQGVFHGRASSRPRIRSTGETAEYDWCMKYPVAPNPLISLS